jgi:formylglycine-generating enzyme required for sulfatase activity
VRFREGDFEFDRPQDLVNLLKSIARAHVAQLARFWRAQRRDARRNVSLPAEASERHVTGDPTNRVALNATDSQALRNSKEMKTRPATVIARALYFALGLVILSSLDCKKVERTETGAVSATTTKDAVEMVLVPGGSFQMGSGQEEDESPHRVDISSFYMDKYEVTQEEYERVVGKNPSRWKGDKKPVDQIRWADAARYCNARSRLEGLEPVYDESSWHCRYEASGYRLPTEAEWEYAARAGTTAAYFFGDDASKLERYAWFKKTSTRGTCPVGRKQLNSWGLGDMYGNVWEWCGDYYQEDYYQRSSEKDPQGPRTGKTRVVRGGCWDSRPDNCRSSHRNYEDPGFTDICFAKDVNGFIGIRCVRPRR